MSNPDHLLEFDKLPVKPRSFYAILFFVLMVVTVYLFLIFPSLKYNLNYLTAFQFYFYALLLVYPLVGAYGYLNNKKYGWVIFAHYTLTSLVLTVALVFDGFEFKYTNGEIVYLKLILILLSILLNLMSVIFLFRKTILDLFGLNRTHIFLAILLSIFFPILNAIFFAFFF